jgi:RND family efflux transporter MFP subunit
MNLCRLVIPFVLCSVLPVSLSSVWGQQAKPQGPPPVPVQVAWVKQESVSEQITLVGSTEAVVRSTIAAEVSGLVESFPVKEGDFVQKGQVLVILRSTALWFRLEAAEAVKGKVQADLDFAKKELIRHEALKGSNSIAERKYDEVVFQHASLVQELQKAEAEIKLLRDEISKKKVVAPFSGFVAKEHTQVGEWLSAGSPVVSLVDLSQVRVSVDVPERYIVQIALGSPVQIHMASLPEIRFQGKVSAILPEGDANARTFPVHVILSNDEAKIKGAMEARGTFNLGAVKDALLVPKDAVVTSGGNRMVYVVSDQTAQPIPVEVVGYYNGNVAIKGPVQPGTQVVIRGNERLRPGQPVTIAK